MTNSVGRSALGAGSTTIVHQLEESVITPFAADLRVGRRQPELGESVSAQDFLRSNVVDQGGGLESMQTEFTEGCGRQFGHGGAGQPAAVRLFRHPITDPAGLAVTALDAEQCHPPHGLSVLVHDDAGPGQAGGVFGQRPLDGLLLTGLGVERLGSRGIPRGKEFSIGDDQPREPRGVAGSEQTGNRHDDQDA